MKNLGLKALTLNLFLLRLLFSSRSLLSPVPVLAFSYSHLSSLHCAFTTVIFQCRCKFTAHCVLLSFNSSALSFDNINGRVNFRVESVDLLIFRREGFSELTDGPIIITIFTLDEKTLFGYIPSGGHLLVD